SSPEAQAVCLGHRFHQPPRVRSAPGPNSFCQLAQGPASSTVSEFMAYGDDDSNRPVNHLECGHEGEPRVPRETWISMLGGWRGGCRVRARSRPCPLCSLIPTWSALIRHVSLS